MIVDRHGIIWIGTENGVDRYDPVQNKFDHPDVLSNSSPPDPGAASGISMKTAMAIFGFAISTMAFRYMTP